MKKNRIFCWILSVVLLLQWMTPVVHATQTDESESEPESESTSQTATPDPNAVPDVAYGNATVTNGCRTIDGMVPLGGQERILDTAQAVFVYEVNTETVVYAYCPDIRLAPANMSKIMTALIALEEGNLDDVITVSTREISKLPAGSLTLPFKSGEQVTLRDLLYALILQSDNDAAILIAEYVDGSEAAFVERMNQRAQAMGCTNTYFTNCHGLDDSQQYTTARDVARITREAIEIEAFVEIFGATTYTIQSIHEQEEADDVDDEKRRSIVTSGNHLVYGRILPQFSSSKVTGGMPGYVSAASGASISFTASANGMDYVFVLLGCNRTFKANGWAVDYYGNFNESLVIIDKIFSNYTTNQLLYDGQILRQFTVANGTNDVTAISQDSLTTVMPKEAHLSNLSLRYSVSNGGLTAPIAENQQIGTVQMWYNSCCVAETELYAQSAVRASDASGLEIYGVTRDDSDISGILGFFGIVLLVILVPTAVYLAYNSYRRQMARARHRRRRASRRRSR